MKTERRHDLGTNELARWTTVWIEKVKPYSTLLISALVVLLGMAAVGSMWDSASESEQEAAWGAFAIAASSNDLGMTNMQKVAMQDEYKGTVMQEWAFVTWADRQLFVATQEYLIDRDSAKEKLRQIVSVYEQLAESSSEDQLRNRARYGLGQVYELQNKLEKAGEQFDLVQGDLEALARERADHLLSPGVKESYEWLATAELPRRSLQNAPGTPGSKPAFEADLPDASGAESDLGTKSLEEIFGGIGEGDSEDRYGTESQAGETENLDDLFDDAETDDEAAPVDTDAAAETAEADKTDTEDTNEP